MNLNWCELLDDEKRKLIFGNEEEDSLTKGYDKKRVVHAGGKGKVVEPSNNMRVWMKESSMKTSGKKLVYINVPFCQTRCAYCGFFKNFAKDSMMEDFTSALVAEIQQGGKLPHMSSGEVNAVYIGGGTPGALNRAQIERILQATMENLPLANDCEVTFETRTYQFDTDKIETCLENGVNRFSLGVQSFDSAARKSIGRVDDGEIVSRKIEELKSFNSAAVSIDLMYGLPFQSEDDFIEDILHADSLGVDGMALYQLNVFDKGKMDEKIKSGKMPPPAKTSEQAIYHIKSYKLMKNLGYLQPSVAHWTRGTRDRSLYNRLSKEGHMMHAFGVGAGGRTQGYGYFTHVAMEPYLKMVQAGVKPIMGMSMSPHNSRLLNLITSQVDSGFLRFDVINGEAGKDLNTLFEPLLNSWKSRGMVTFDNNVMKLTPEGQFWYVNMAQALIDVLAISEDSGYELESAKVAAQN